MRSACTKASPSVAIATSASCSEANPNKVPASTMGRRSSISIPDSSSRLYRSSRPPCPISQLGQVYLEIGAYAARITPEHDNPVGEQDRLFDIVCNHEYGGGRHLLAQPQLHQFIAKVFGCKNIKRGKGL